MTLREYDPAQLRDPNGRWTVSDLFKEALKGAEALAAAPASMDRAPNGHSGDYTGAKLHGPDGMGSAISLAEYEGVEYVNTNSRLRGFYRDDDHGFESPEEWAAFLAKQDDRIREIDKTMSVSTLTSDVEVHRAVASGKAIFGRDVWYGDVIDWKTSDFDLQDKQIEEWEAGKRPDLTGMRWLERGYSSTTADPDRAERYVERWKKTNSALEGEPIIFRILAPKGAGGVRLSEWGHEAEILLQHDLTFEVDKDHGVGDDGVRRLDIKVVQP